MLTGSAGDLEFVILFLLFWVATGIFVGVLGGAIWLLLTISEKIWGKHDEH